MSENIEQENPDTSQINEENSNGETQTEKGGVPKRKKKKDPVLKTLQIKYNFWKWFCGTFLIGAFTAYTTYIFKDYQLRLQTREKESVYLKPYLDNYMKLFEKNQAGYDRGADMAKFLSCVAVDKDYKKGWDDLFQYCQEQILQLKKQNVTITNDSVRTVTKLDSFINIDAKHHSKLIAGKPVSTNFNLQAVHDSIFALTNQIAAQNLQKANNLYKIDPDLATAVLPSPDQHKNDVPTKPIGNIPKNNDSYVLKEDSVKYISKNYAQTFNGNFDITVNSVSIRNQTVNVRFSLVANGNIINVIKDDVDLNNGDEQTVYSPDQQFKYVVKVQSMSKTFLRNYAYFEVKSYTKSQ